MLGTPNGGTRIADILCGAQNLVFDPRTLALREVLRRSFGECRGPQDGLYQLQQWYVQRVFNKQVPDRRGTFYATIAGTETQDVRGALLDGEDDGLVTVASAEYLSIFNSSRAGKHVPRGVFQVDHNELLSPDEAPAPRSLCTLYTVTCSRVPASPATSPATQAPLAADVTAQAVASGVEPAQSEAVAIAAGATVELPLRFEGAARTFVMVVGEGLRGSVNGADLAPGGLFGTSILTADLTNPADAPLRLTNAGTGAVEAGIIVFVESDRRMAVTATPELAAPGQPVAVAVSLSGIEAGDAPSAAVVDGSGAVVTQLALTAAGTSTWTTSFTPGTPGAFTVVAAVGGSRPRWASQPLTVASGGARLTGTFTESVPDDNANGLADALVVTPTIDVAASGPYRLAAQLVDGTGTVVASAGSRAVLTAGTQSLALSFPGLDIFRSARSGPYRLVDVVLSNDDDAMAMEQVVAELGATAGYDYRRFEHFPVEIDRDAFADRAVDGDGDGLYDVLAVSGQASVDGAGSYAVNARLVAADGSELGEFRAAGVDGPYTVEDLSIYPLADVDVLWYLVVAHQTAPYAAAGQVDSITFARLRSMIDSSAAAGEIDGAGFLRSLQAKVDAGEAAYDRGQLKAARNQLEALRNELWAQRGKRVAEPAYLRLDGAAEDLITRL